MQTSRIGTFIQRGRILLVGLVVFALAGCGGESSSQYSRDDAKATVQARNVTPTAALLPEWARPYLGHYPGECDSRRWHSLLEAVWQTQGPENLGALAAEDGCSVEEFELILAGWVLGVEPEPRQSIPAPTSTGERLSSGMGLPDPTPLALTFAEADVMQAVGIVLAETAQGTNQGTGVVVAIDGKYAYLLTNTHVVQSAEDIAVVLNGEVYEDVSRAGIERNRDVYWLSVCCDVSVTPLPIATEPAQPNDGVVTVGYPGGSLTWTTGVVIGRGPIRGHAFPAIFHTAELRPGNSGGPLLNEAGEVVGLVFSTAYQEYGAVPIESLEHLDFFIK